MTFLRQPNPICPGAMRYSCAKMVCLPHVGLQWHQLLSGCGTTEIHVGLCGSGEHKIWWQGLPHPFPTWAWSAFWTSLYPILQTSHSPPPPPKKPPCWAVGIPSSAPFWHPSSAWPLHWQHMFLTSISYWHTLCTCMLPVCHEMKKLQLFDTDNCDLLWNKQSYCF